MKDRVIGAFAVASTIAMLTVTWYTLDIIHWLDAVPPRPNDAPLVAITHIWSTQMAVAILCGVIWPIPMPSTERQLWVGWWLRSFVLALTGGIIGSFLLKPYAWWMAPCLAIFGLVQWSLMGTILGTHLRRTNLQKRAA